MESSVIPDIAKNIFYSAQYIALDTIIFCTLVLLYLIYALYFGKGKFLSFMFSFFIATTLYIHFPYTDKIIQVFSWGGALANLTLFLSFLMISVIITRNVIKSDFGFRPVRRVWSAFLSAFSGAIFSLALLYRVIPNVAEIHAFTNPLAVFINPLSQIVWWLLLLPLIMAMSVRGRRY